jgi:hypothetical protein
MDTQSLDSNVARLSVISTEMALQDSVTYSSTDADLVLISSDNVRFKVYRCILALGSPFFANTLTLPQPQAEASVHTLPFVHMEETSEIIDILLHYMYPREHPTPSFDQICVLLGVADKYEMEWLENILRTLLVSDKFLMEQPLSVYMVTQFYNLVPEHTIACRSTLEVDLSFIDLNELTSKLACIRMAKQFILGEFLRLLQFHQRRTKRMIEVIRPPEKRYVCTPWPEYCDCTPSGQCNMWCYPLFVIAERELLKRPTTTGLFSPDRLKHVIFSANCKRCEDKYKTQGVAMVEKATAALESIPTHIEGEGLYKERQRMVDLGLEPQ